MAITSSAKKAHRASLKKRVFNLRLQDKMTTSVKVVKRLVKEGKAKEALESLSLAYQAIDKAAKSNFITKNTASRKKSRLSASIKSLSKK
jgi:small subunit ribosomal protein S20